MLENLIAEYVANKAQMDALKARNDELAQKLAKLAIPKGADKGEVIGSGYKLKIERRVNERWDQTKLDEFRGRWKGGLFDTLFRTKYEPNVATLRHYMKTADRAQKEEILSAVTTTHGRPSIKLEKINENN